MEETFPPDGGSPQQTVTEGVMVNLSRKDVAILITALGELVRLNHYTEAEPLLKHLKEVKELTWPRAKR